MLMVGKLVGKIPHVMIIYKGYCPDRLLVFNHGRIVESGTHDELIARNGTYRLLVDNQML